MNTKERIVQYKVNVKGGRKEGRERKVTECNWC